MTSNTTPAIFFEKVLSPVETAVNVSESPIKIVWDGRKHQTNYFEKKSEGMHFNPSSNPHQGSALYFDFINS